MKAITVKHLPATHTKPRRIKVQAEGVPHLIFDSNSTTPREGAQRLCVKFGWGTDLIEGTLPNGDLVYVFNPHAGLARRESILVDAMAEVKATNDGESDQPISAIVEGCIAELRAACK